MFFQPLVANYTHKQPVWGIAEGKKCKPQLLNQDQAPVFVSTYSNQERRTCSCFPVIMVVIRTAASEDYHLRSSLI